MGKALYRKYRSRSLDEIVGQSHVTELLSRAIKNDRVAHAYLFTGPRGVGKTSIARILAHEITKLPYDSEQSHLDIIEIDAASNNGVDDIRELRERVQLAPINASKKIYIIDEVHMLSKAAFNALLKTLEEPPEHVVFILATTDLDKLPETIVSRTQRHTFRRATETELIENMRRIAKAENIRISDEALQLIAEQSDGGYRDSVSLLDQLANSVDEKQEITANVITESLGLAASTQLSELIRTLVHKDAAGMISLLKSMHSSGIQSRTIAAQLIRHIQSVANEYPMLLPLLGDLIDVPQSSLPDAKLLSALSTYVIDTTSVMITAPDILESPVVTTPAVASPPQKPASSKSVPKTPPKEEVKSKKHSDAPADVATIPKMPAKRSAQTAELEWPKLLETVRVSSIALYTLLDKCSHEVDGSTIRIFTKNAFYKKKIEDARAVGIIYTALVDTTGTEWEIECVPSTKPHSDSQTAAIADMMGGGEEVSVNE